MPIMAEPEVWIDGTGKKDQTLYTYGVSASAIETGSKYERDALAEWWQG
jgi:hypothetical protein